VTLYNFCYPQLSPHKRMRHMSNSAIGQNVLTLGGTWHDSRAS
jgi:hypothetical protein